MFTESWWVTWDLPAPNLPYTSVIDWVSTPPPSISSISGTFQESFPICSRRSSTVAPVSKPPTSAASRAACTTSAAVLSPTSAAFASSPDDATAVALERFESVLSEFLRGRGSDTGEFLEVCFGHVLLAWPLHRIKARIHRTESETGA